MFEAVGDRTIAAVAAALFGAAIGSFLNVVIHRQPRGLSLSSPPSSCPACSTPIRPLDNVPVVSYLLLRGRCRSCGAPIGWRYPAVELLTAGLFAGVFARFARIEEAVFAAGVVAVLVALAFIDLDHRRVPNRIVLPATAVAAVWVVVASIARGEPRQIAHALGSGLAGFTLLFVLAVASGGLGFGDVKLMAFIGVAVGRAGAEAFVLALFAGFVIGGVVATGLLVSGRRGRKDAIPFAPSLCAGALVGLYAGPGPVRAWLGLG